MKKAPAEDRRRPAYVGSRGWVALGLDAGAIHWDEVAELVAGSYRLIAPKKTGSSGQDAVITGLT